MPSFNPSVFSFQERERENEGVGTSLAFVVTKRALHDRKLYTNKGSRVPCSLD